MGPRFYEIMLSGRALLLCNRHERAYAPLGLVEGVHAAMFNTTAEFEATLLYYLTHEHERRKVVDAAREFALARHTWRARAQEFMQQLPHVDCHTRGGGPRAPHA